MPAATTKDTIIQSHTTCGKFKIPIFPRIGGMKEGKALNIASKVATPKASKQANKQQPQGTPCQTEGDPQASLRGDH